MTVDELIAELQRFPGYWTVATSDSEVGYPPVELVEAKQACFSRHVGNATPTVVLS